MKKLFTLLSFLFIVTSYSQSPEGFFLTNVSKISNSYNSAFIPLSNGDKSIKNSITVVASSNTINATFVFYFGENEHKTEVIVINTNVYQIRTFLKNEEFENLSNLLKEKDKLGIGYENASAGFPDRVLISKFN